MSSQIPPVPLFLLRFDGSSKNPGASGIGYTLGTIGPRVEGQGSVNNTGPAIPAPNTLVNVGSPIGDATNNEAEYQALIGGLRHAVRLGMWWLDIESDSMLVVRQVEGAWKVRDKWLKRLHAEAMGLLSLLSDYSIRHIVREDNAAADALSRTSLWDEPELPTPAPVLGRKRSLHEWQAAFVRHHWRAGIRNSYFWGRIYDIDPPLIEHIGNGETYKNAGFAGMPDWTLIGSDSHSPAPSVGV